MYSLFCLATCWIIALVLALSGPSLEAQEPANGPGGDDGKEQGIRLVKGCRVVFATTKQGVKHLRGRDQFITAMSLFDRQSRVGKSEAVTEADYLEFLSGHVLEWEPAERQQVALAFANMAKKLAAYDLPLPAEIVMIKTSGGEEGNAAYCRTNAIVLPKKMVSWQGNKLERLLTHELFHVLSSHNPELRAKMYKIIGFSTVKPIGLPKSLADRKITNPDAPQLDSVIKLDTADGPVMATPILFAKWDYDDSRDDSFFAYLTFRLMAVQQREGIWVAVTDDGEPQLLDPKKTPSFTKQIGGNTGYIIHPDEIMADNFVHLIHRTKELKTPGIVKQLSELLKSDRDQR